MNRLAYFTAKTPFSAGETFILTEMLAIKKLGADLLIVPRDASCELFDDRGAPLLKDALTIPLFDINIAKELLKFICWHAILFSKIINDIAFKARSVKIAIKNLVTLPKSLFLVRILSEKKVSHIHAHWGSTTSTMAYIISKLTNIPWSFTVHRWDIRENNLLKDKCKAASFVRTISEKGRAEMIKIVKDACLIKKISVIHMGVDIPETFGRSGSSSERFTILCPANLLPVKGHKYLIEACRTLFDKDIKFKCLITGDGPLEGELKTMASDVALKDSIEFLGQMPHQKLLGLYNSGRVNAVVLSSIVTENGEKEGIPVALMEAMAYSIPVISTNTGAISELIGDGSGIMLKEKDPEAIASAIENLINDPSYCSLVGERGRKKVEKDFNISIISKGLLNLFGMENCE